MGENGCETSPRGVSVRGILAQVNLWNLEVMEFECMDVSELLWLRVNSKKRRGFRK